MRELTPLEARALAVLVEKQATVPDTYPLSLNALGAGCNQKTARDPVMEVEDGELAEAVAGLKSLTLVLETSGGRVARYEHNLPRGLGVPSAAGALLATLVLRGPQTAAELKLHSERLHRFADVGSVEAYLQELADKSPARVRLLARAPGAREPRWAHLLCGEPVLPAAGGSAAPGEPGAALGGAAFEALQAQVKAQAEAIAILRRQLEQLAAQLGATLD